MRRAVSVLISALAGILVCGPAVAAPGGGGRVTFGVRPTGKAGPDNRPTFAYAATPGAVLADQVEISNNGPEKINLKVYASDAFTTATGGFDVLAAGGTADDAGGWVKLARTAVTIPARGKVIVPFTLTVPATATPGDHSAGIVASLSSFQTDTAGNRVAVDQRVGARVYLRISGTLAPGLAVERLTAEYHPNSNPFKSGRTTLTYRVRNTGNVRLGANQRVTVRTLWGGERVADGIANVTEILPGDAVDVVAEIGGALPAVWLTGSVHAEPVAQAGDQKLQLTAVSRERGFWALSWPSAAILLVLLLGAGLVVNRRRRRRSAPVSGHVEG